MNLLPWFLNRFSKEADLKGLDTVLGEATLSKFNCFNQPVENSSTIKGNNLLPRKEIAPLGTTNALIKLHECAN